MTDPDRTPSGGSTPGPAGGRVPGRELMDYSYQEFPLVEEAFAAALDESLDPRGPDSLYEIVAGLAIGPGSLVLDVGCGDGRHAFELGRRFGCAVHGVDPVAGNIEAARARAAADIGTNGLSDDRHRFEVGVAEALPEPDGSIDLVWCRDMLAHVGDLRIVFEEMRRVLRPDGRVLVYQMVATDRLSGAEREWLWETSGVVPSSIDGAAIEAAIAGAGLMTLERVVFGTEWGEWLEERTGANGRRLLHLARLLREPDRYVSRFGRPAYDLKVADALWHVFGMIGKLDRRAWVLGMLPG
jgi:SAM-dependent methyltransferase